MSHYIHCSCGLAMYQTTTGLLLCERCDEHHMHLVDAT